MPGRASQGVAGEVYPGWCTRIQLALVYWDISGSSSRWCIGTSLDPARVGNAAMDQLALVMPLWTSSRWWNERLRIQLALVERTS